MTKRAANASPFLDVRNVSVHFGGVVALDSLSFDLHEGQIVGLIGPNGAGKTTLFNCLSRLYAPSSGDIAVQGASMLPLPPHRIAGLGVGRTFQNVAAFSKLSVRDNILVGGHSEFGGRPLADVLRPPGWYRGRAAMAEVADELIAWLGLGPVADLPVAAQPFAIQKRVELARAMATKPRLLLLDEPAAGLNHEEVEDLKSLIREIRDARGVSILLVEHHMSLVMAVSDKVVVLNFGKKIAEGTPAEVQQNPAVIEAYLGAHHGAA